MNYTGSVPDSERAVDWRDTAACSEYDPELFFPVGNTGRALLQIEEAKAVCRRCPVMDQCLQWALESGEDYGIWGGLSETERRALKRRRARGRADQPAGKPDTPATVQELWDQRSTPLGDGHVGWTGAEQGRCREGVFTPLQVAFIVSRGRKPVGKLKRLCEVNGCIAHVEDLDERTRCGTRPGYRRHLTEGVEPCVACRQANADADRRLAWTGTTQASMPKLGPGRPREPRPECGTTAAYHRHRRYKEPIDDACRAANSQADAERKKRAIAETVAA